MTPKQLDALADEWVTTSNAHLSVCSPAIRNAGDAAAKALRSIAATMRAGRLTEERIDEMAKEHEVSIYRIGVYPHAFAETVSNAAVLAAMPRIAELEAVLHYVRLILPNEKWADDSKRMIDAAIAPQKGGA